MFGIELKTVVCYSRADDTALVAQLPPPQLRLLRLRIFQTVCSFAAWEHPGKSVSGVISSQCANVDRNVLFLMKALLPQVNFVGNNTQ